MLGKLLKYDWKRVGKVGLFLSLAQILLALIGVIYFKSPAWANLFRGTNTGGLETVSWALIGVFGFLGIILLLAGTVYAMMIFLGVSFYKSMYSEEGYLTHTLPVTANQLILSKTLVGGTWMMITSFLSIGSMILLLAAFVSSIMEGQLLDGNVFVVLSKLFDGISLMLQQMYGFSLVGFWIFITLTSIVGCYLGVIILFGSLTIGQLTKRHKGFMGVLVYFGIAIVQMVVSMIYQIINMATEISSYSSGEIEINLNESVISSFIVTLVVAIVLYFFSHLIIRKKLNLD